MNRVAIFTTKDVSGAGHGSYLHAYDHGLTLLTFVDDKSCAFKFPTRKDAQKFVMILKQMYPELASDLYIVEVPNGK